MPRIPKFRDEAEEAQFWETHDIVDYLEDTVPAEGQLIGPRPRKVHITLRLDQDTIDDVKKVAEKLGIGYQTLIRMWVKEQVALRLGTTEREQHSAATMTKSRVSSKPA